MCFFSLFLLLQLLGARLTHFVPLCVCSRWSNRTRATRRLCIVVGGPGSSATSTAWPWRTFRKCWKSTRRTGQLELRFLAASAWWRNIKSGRRRSTEACSRSLQSGTPRSGNSSCLAKHERVVTASYSSFLFLSFSFLSFPSLFISFLFSFSSFHFLSFSFHSFLSFPSLSFNFLCFLFLSLHIFPFPFFLSLPFLSFNLFSSPSFHPPPTHTVNKCLTDEKCPCYVYNLPLVIN